MNLPPRPAGGLDLVLALAALAAAACAALAWLPGAPAAALVAPGATRGAVTVVGVLLGVAVGGVALARWRAARRPAATPTPGGGVAAAGGPEAQDVLGAIVHASPLAMVVIDPDPPLVRLWNPAAERLFGWRADQVLGQPIPTIPPERIAEAQAYRRTVAAGRTEYDFETRRLRADGSLIDVRMSASPLPLDPQGTGRILLIFSDVSARKQAERALVQSEATLRAVYDSTPVCMGVVEVALDGRNILHVYDNPVTCGLFGVPPGGTANRLASSMGATPETIALWIEHYRRAEAEGAPVRFDFDIDIPNDRRWFSASVSPIGPGPSGRMRYCYVADDVTERHRAAERLQESEAAARLAMQVARLGTWNWSAADDAVELDARGREIAGLPPDGAAPAPTRLLERIHPEDRERLRDRWHEALAADGPGLLEEEFRVRQGDGTTRWVVSRAQLLHGGARRPAQLLGTLLDTTERKLNEEMLQQADRRKDEFLATLAHELRNPLAPIRNGVHLLRRVASAVPAAERPLAMMERQVGHMVRLIDDLLDVSRVTRDLLVLHKARIPLANVMQHALETCQPAIDAAGHALELCLPGPDVEVDADLTRLSQVIANLLHNAAKYTPDGGRIVLAGGRDGDTARVTVEDNGQGIPAEMLTRIFDMFTQVDRSLERSRGGLGLGLTIARRLAELHGGRVEAYSEGPQRGSRFVLELPACAPDTAVVASPDPAAPAPAPEDGDAARPRRVLVADDNADSGDSLGHLLRLAGNDTTVVRDGLQAFKAAEDLRPDAVLLDLGMPGLNGYEVARRLRMQEWGRSMLLIAVTGWGQQADRLRSEAAGFDHHVVKPVEPDQIGALLDAPRGRNRAAQTA